MMDMMKSEVSTRAQRYGTGHGAQFLAAYA